uniref:Sulfotransfer_1 domain-containing protein n=1 Tax=Parastrongyloides trichosuri TaxID=131310 RepID=A0A0N4ZZG0_PARTI
MPLFSLPNNNNYIVPKYKLHTCTVGGKNISSYVSLIFCYLLNQKKYQTVLKYFDDIKGAMNPCHKINGPFTTKSVIKNYGKNSSDFWGEWKHLVIIKNPIDRFLDNFIDLCSNSSDKIKKSDCFNCNSSDMKCFLEKLYKDINKVMKNKKKIPNKRIKNYFYPQTSHCDYTLNHESIRYLNISLPYYQFSKQLINIIESSRVPKKDLTLIEKDISQKMEKHLLNNNGIERKLHEKTLYNDNYLLDLVTKIYYQDFVAFNYQLPSFT